MHVGKWIRTTVIAPLALGVAFAAGTARVAGAQEQPAAQPPAAQPPAQAEPAPTATFNGSAGILLVQIKPDQTAAYENLLSKLKEALSKSEKPERKKMAEGWKVYKSADPMGGNTLYVHIVNPVSPGQDYLEAYKLISEVFPSEVQDLYAKTKDAFAPNGLGRLNLTLVTSMAPGM